MSRNRNERRESHLFGSLLIKLRTLKKCFVKKNMINKVLFLSIFYEIYRKVTRISSIMLIGSKIIIA